MTEGTSQTMSLRDLASLYEARRVSTADAEAASKRAVALENEAAIRLRERLSREFYRDPIPEGMHGRILVVGGVGYQLRSGDSELLRYEIREL